MNSARLIRSPLSSAGKKGHIGRGEHVPGRHFEPPAIACAAVVMMSSPQTAIREAVAVKQSGHRDSRLMLAA
jgi:hypothetical protein